MEMVGRWVEMVHFDREMGGDGREMGGDGSF